MGQPNVSAPSRLDALQARLSSRRSIFHLAHAAVSLLVAFISTGTALMLWWDSNADERAPLAVFSALAVVLFAHGLVRWALGKKARREEQTLFEELKALRKSMGLDDPKVLLPR
jgi:hypothetical protein